MKKDTPVVKVFTHRGECFLYDLYSNQLLKISKGHMIEIQKMLKMGIDEYKIRCKGTQAFDDILMLIKSGFFHVGSIEMIRHKESEYLPYILNRCLSFLQLQVTRDCNFKCRYCIFTREHDIIRHHEKLSMPWEIAQHSIDFLYDHSQDSDRITITFYGGEPLLNFQLIEKVVKYAENKFSSKEIVYSLTTNGSILNIRMIDFFIKYNIDLLISLDGPNEIQNRHRKYYTNGSETFETVFKNVMKIREKNNSYFEKHVMFSPVIFADEKESTVMDFFKNLGISPSLIRKQYANLQGIDYIHNTKEGIMDLPKDAQMMALANRQVVLFNDVFHEKSPIPINWEHYGCCIPGAVRLFVNVHGDFYPCEKVIETSAVSVGSIYKGLDLDKVMQIMNIACLTEDECKDCWALRFCSMCAIHCTDSENNIISRQMKLAYCKVQKELAESFLKTKCSPEGTEKGVKHG